MIDGNWMGNNWIHIRGWEAHGQDDGLCPPLSYVCNLNVGAEEVR